MKELLEKDSKCLALEESSGDVAHLNNRIKKLQKELEATTELQVEKMTLEIKVHELEERLNGAGDNNSATPKSDRKLNKVYGLFGKFYGKEKHENPGELTLTAHGDHLYPMYEVVSRITPQHSLVHDFRVSKTWQ